MFLQHSLSGSIWEWKRGIEETSQRYWIKGQYPLRESGEGRMEDDSRAEFNIVIGPWVGVKIETLKVSLRCAICTASISSNRSD